MNNCDFKPNLECYYAIDFNKAMVNKSRWRDLSKITINTNII